MLPMRYQFIIEGELSDRALSAFPELATTRRLPGTTVLFGPVDDSTVLRGMLSRIDNLGLTLLEMSRLPD
ncbi:hypothetical protein [Nocardia sp. NBC_01388]|uniref:hypothetical protein n=1 Tax=Nocardia sp. NBC_01388 TaxID=2903596 RepID=UPI00324B62FD